MICFVIRVGGFRLVRRLLFLWLSGSRRESVQYAKEEELEKTEMEILLLGKLWKIFLRDEGCLRFDRRWIELVIEKLTARRSIVEA